MSNKKGGHLSLIDGFAPNGETERSGRAALKKARALAEKGKGSKTLVREAGINIEEAREIVQAYRRAATRRSSKEILEDMLVGTRQMLQKAREGFMADPSGKAAYAVSTILSEQRSILEMLNKEKKPEQLALSILQDAVQILIKDMLRDTVEEARKAQERCVAVSSSTKQREAVEKAFEDMANVLADATDGHYENVANRICEIQSCKIEDVQSLAAKMALETNTGEGS